MEIGEEFYQNHVSFGGGIDREGHSYEKMFFDDDEDDHAFLLEYLGSEEHQTLMDEIAEAIKTEFAEDYEGFECGEVIIHDDFILDTSNWSEIEAESYQLEDNTIICPLCRLVLSFGPPYANANIVSLRATSAFDTHDLV
jgi:hypothetical protein